MGEGFLEGAMSMFGLGKTKAAAPPAAPAAPEAPVVLSPRAQEIQAAQNARVTTETIDWAAVEAQNSARSPVVDARTGVVDSPFTQAAARHEVPDTGVTPTSPYRGQR